MPDKGVKLISDSIFQVICYFCFLIKYNYGKSISDR